MTDAVYCPPNVDCPCYAALTAENERLRAENDMIRRTAAAWSDAHKAQSDLALKYVSELNRVLAENERLRTVNAEMLALFDKLGAKIERIRSREYRTYLLIRRLGFDCGSAKFITKRDAAPEEKP